MVETIHLNRDARVDFGRVLLKYVVVRDEQALVILVLGLAKQRVVQVVVFVEEVVEALRRVVLAMPACRWYACACRRLMTETFLSTTIPEVTNGRAPVMLLSSSRRIRRYQGILSYSWPDHVLES